MEPRNIQPEHQKWILSAKEIPMYLQSHYIDKVCKGLRQKWFFDSKHEIIHSNYFENLFQYTSIHTRLRIIKILSRSLVNSKIKARDFFDSINHLYGFEQAMPILFCCSEEFVSETLQSSNIRLPVRIIDMLFERYPRVVIMYLNVRKEYLSDYEKFLPKLLKNYSLEFLALTNDMSVHCGKAAIRSLAKNNQDVLVNNPQRFIKSPSTLKALKSYFKQKQFETLYTNLLLSMKDFSFPTAIAYLESYPKGKRLNLLIKTYQENFNAKLLSSLNEADIQKELKLVSDLLTIQEFAIVLENIFRKPENKFEIDKMVNYLDYYPKKDRLGLVIKTYQSIHNKYLLEDVHFAFLKSEKFLILLPRYKNVEIVTKIMHLYKKNSEKYFHWTCCLPLDDSFDILLNAIETCNKINGKIKILKKLLHSCILYHSQLFLTRFLSYLLVSSINNLRTQSVIELLREVVTHFKIERMSNSCWIVFVEILFRVHVKYELFPSDKKPFGNMLEGALHRAFIQMDDRSRSDKYAIANKITDIYLELQMVLLPEPSLDFNFPVDLEILCITQLLTEIQKKYDENVKTWKQKNSEASFVKQVIKKLLACSAKSEIHKKAVKLLIENIMYSNKDCPWIKEVVERKLTCEEERDYEFEDLVKRLNSEFYAMFTSTRSFTYDDCHRQIVSGEACNLLRTNLRKVRGDFDVYLSVCQDLLRANRRRGAQAAKRFCRRVKEDEDLRKRTILQCKREKAKPGSLTILMMLRGEGSQLLVSDLILIDSLPYLLKKDPIIKRWNYNVKERYKLGPLISVAINAANPPVEQSFLKRLITYEHIKVLTRSIVGYGRRVSEWSALVFVRLLMGQKDYLLQKLGVILAFEVANFPWLREMLDTALDPKATHRLLASPTATGRALKRLKKEPSENSWVLVQICVKGLGLDDDASVRALANTAGMPEQFADAYVMMLLDRVEELAGDHFANLEWKERSVVEILRGITAELALSMSKQSIMEILKRYFFKPASPRIWSAASSFADVAFSRSELYDPSNEIDCTCDSSKSE